MALQLQNNKDIILKEGATDAKYQSTFLPIFQDAETRIKLMIVTAFLALKNPLLLRAAIAGIIVEVAKKIPDTLYDKQSYIDGMTKRADFYIRKYYQEPKSRYELVRSKLYSTIPAGIKRPIINDPKQLMDFVKRPNLWAEAKGISYIRDYEKEVFRRMDEFARMPMTTYEPGKKPISLWQKAELDVRYNKQMNMYNDLINAGTEYAWTSSHVDASKRCEKWQGKLMSLTEHATMSGFRVGKKDGHWVYSLTDIMAQTDKYGYHNNIICGFNCRHRLIPYETGKSAPKQYSRQEVAQQRDIETHIREMERAIRYQKTRLLFYEKIGDRKIVQNLQKSIKMMIEEYKKYCERNGYAWFQYRINIREGSNQYL